MNNGEFVSRVSNQLRMITKDDYINDRLILSIGQTIARKFITQKIQRRSIDRDASLYREIKCIEFESENIFKCPYVEFKSCNELSKSVKSIEDIGLVFTRYGSSIKELYSIDRTSEVLTESTLYQLRVDSNRLGGERENNKFYILDNHIYVPRKVKTLSGIILALDQFELDSICDCTDGCQSAWDLEFIAPDSMLEDIIGYTLQHMGQAKSIPEDESPNLSNRQ